jgi:hypothetical protein
MKAKIAKNNIDYNTFKCFLSYLNKIVNSNKYLITHNSNLKLNGFDRTVLHLYTIIILILVFYILKIQITINDFIINCN